MYCTKCGTNNSDGANYCSACGAQLQSTNSCSQSAAATNGISIPPKADAESVYSKKAASSKSPPIQRRVSLILALGVIFIPFVFGWFLLREGYSKNARVLGLGWTALFCILAFFGENSTPTKKQDETSTIATDSHIVATEPSTSMNADEAWIDKENAAMQQKPKGPSSPKFGENSTPIKKQNKNSNLSTDKHVRATGHATPKKSDEEWKKLVWIEEGKEAALQKLKDPGSAKFRNVVFHRGPKNIPVVCGEINSKNGFGGYGGFQRFISAGSPDLTFLEEQISGDFGEVWREFCR